MEESARRFEGRHVVVTGAGSGSGRAIALRLSDEGARVSMLGRRRDALDETERLIRARGDAALVSLSVDIRDPRAVDETFARAACEVAPENVQVNAVLPGWVSTSMAREGVEAMAREMKVSVEDARATAMQAVPLRRMSEPEDIAALVAWLISNDARGITGQGVDMNGGAFMN